MAQKLYFHQSQLACGLWSAFESFWAPGSTRTSQILHNFTSAFRVAGPFWQWIFAFKVQSLWKRHYRCDSLLWRLNCLWYHTIIFSYLDQFLKTVNKILWVVILTINSTQKYVSIDFFKYQSSRDLRRWPGWTSYQALVGSVDSAWGSASSPSLRSSTGSPSGFAGPSCHTMTDWESTFKLGCQIVLF